MRSRQPVECIDSYMSQINKFDRISREEEERLSRLLHSAPTEEERRAARDTLVCANLRLVVKIAHDFKNFGIGFADLVAEGNRGLVVAVDKFDPDNGAKFSVYAGWWIKQSMRHAILWQSRVVRMPSGASQRHLKIRKAANRYFMEHNEMPTDEKLAELAGLPLSAVLVLKSAVTETVSMNDKLAVDSDTTIEATLADSADSTPETANRISITQKAIDKLSELERRIVSAVYGLNGLAIAIHDLACELGLSVKQLQHRLSQILDKLRGLIEPELFGEA